MSGEVISMTPSAIRIRHWVVCVEETFSKQGGNDGLFTLNAVYEMVREISIRPDAESRTMQHVRTNNDVWLSAKRLHSGDAVSYQVGSYPYARFLECKLDPV